MTADEGAIGGGHLSRFQELETVSPTILTTSQLLTTGVDAPTCKNVVLARVIGSMTDFKQIIGRGTRVREDYGKLFFNIVDYTGSATRLFADPDFDGEPALIDEEVIDEDGEVVEQTVVEDESQGDEDGAIEVVLLEFTEDEPPEQRKYYFDGGSVEIAAQVVYELDAEGRQLRVVSYTDYARDKVQGAVPLARGARGRLARAQAAPRDPRRARERGIDLRRLGEVAACPDADPLDLLCHLAFNGPLRTRRERAERLARNHEDFFDRYGPEAAKILGELVDKYAEHGSTQLRLPDVLKVPPISRARATRARSRASSAARSSCGRPSTSSRSCSMRRNWERS